MTKLEINQNDAGQKIFAFIKKAFRDTNLSIIYKWFRLGKIRVNNKRIKNRDYVLQFGDIILVFDAGSNTTKRKWEKVDYHNLEIVYEDQNILIADKDFDLEIHSEFNVCLDNMVRSYLFDKGEFNPDENSFIVSHVHRLDKLTSGLVIYAKNKAALDFFLSTIVNKNQITKTYVAKVEGSPKITGIISGFIDYNGETKKATFKAQEFKMSKQAILDIKKIDEQYVTIELVTGRKHQIRATMEYLKTPIFNDFRYSSKRHGNEHYIALNANQIAFHDLPEPYAYLNEKVFVSNKLTF